MQARAWEMHGAAGVTFADFIGVHAIEPSAVRVRAVGRLIRQRARDGALRVPLLAGGRARLAADTGVEIDHQAEFLGRVCWKCGHGMRGASQVLMTATKKVERIGTSPAWQLSLG